MFHRKPMTGLPEISSVRFQRLACAMTAAVWLTGTCLHAEDVYGKRFDPPRAYFTHGNLNKGGFVSAIKGQDNFLTLYFPAVDNTAGTYTPDGFTYTVRLPGTVSMLDVASSGLSIRKVDWEGKPYVEVTGKLDPKAVHARCFRGAWGVDVTLWYRIEGSARSTEPSPIQVSLSYQGKSMFHSDARLRVYEELDTPPTLDPRHFKLWLHYGPHIRETNLDETAAFVRKAGINAIQIMVGRNDTMREMRKRDFYIIAQRGGSYGRAHKELGDCVTLGQKWFEKEDGGHTRGALPFADAVIWDFEPTPAIVELDDWSRSEFAKRIGVADSGSITEELIKAKHLPEWIRMRQEQYAQAIKHWADFCRSMKPGIDTILTEGRTNVFDPPGQIDYSNYASSVTFCDPMNFTRVRALHHLQQWMKHVPQASFTGCQNVGFSSKHVTFIPAKTIMMQVLSAALVGAKGTSVYPGWSMDGENFVLFNRVMGFLAQHQRTIFEGTKNPADALVSPIPREDVKIQLGDGRTLRNIYPDWDREAIHRTYVSKAGNEYLVVVANWNSNETCYVKVSVAAPEGLWTIADDENRVRYSANAASISHTALKNGFYLEVPPFDYRGFRISRNDFAQPPTTEGYTNVELDRIRSVASTYTKRSATNTASAGKQGDIELTFDDFNQDNQIEYVAKSATHTVWLTPNGTILKWQLRETELRTQGNGLLTDMLWLPSTERSNEGMASTMTLDSRRVREDRVELVFSRAAALPSVGGTVSLRFEKAVTVYANPARVQVTVDITNTSLTMPAGPLNISYRTHHYIDYDETGETFTWIAQDKARTRWKGAANYSAVNANLMPVEATQVFGGYEAFGPYAMSSWGEHFPKQQMLLECIPSDRKQLLQVLRWRSGTARRGGGSGTIEWMYRPVDMKTTKSVQYEYELRLSGGVKTLDASDATKSHAFKLETKPRATVEKKKETTPAAATVKPPEEGLLFFVDFQNGLDATYAAGNAKALVTGEPVIEKTPTGKGVRITEGTQLAYLPAGNVSLDKGKVSVRFKPLWHGVDEKSHYLLTLRPVPGYIYFGKLPDGRLLFNMFDSAGKQHYPWHLIKTMRAETWHTITVTWDCEKGRMQLFLDGRKVASYEGEPWKMGKLTNGRSECRLLIPESADAIIDEIKIWNQP